MLQKKKKNHFYKILKNWKKFADNSLRLFSSEFVENNKDKCKIIYEKKNMN